MPESSADRKSCTRSISDLKRTLNTAGIVLALLALYTTPHNARTAALRFEVIVAPGLIQSPQSGRLLVVVSAKSQPEPRLTIGQTGLDASPVFGRDINNFAPGGQESLD